MGKPPAFLRRVLAEDQGRQALWADDLTRARSGSHAWNRHRLATVFMDPVDSPQAVGTLAFMAREAPRRFRGQWRRAYAARVGPYQAASPPAAGCWRWRWRCLQR